MSTQPRTVTLPTIDHGPITLTCPDWCVGHADHQPDTYRSDLDHTGPEHRLTHHGHLLWTAFLAQTPYAGQARLRDAGVFVEQGHFARTLDLPGLYDLAATFEAHADRLRELADQLAALNGGEQS